MSYAWELTWLMITHTGRQMLFNKATWLIIHGSIHLWKEHNFTPFIWITFSEQLIFSFDNSGKLSACLLRS